MKKLPFVLLSIIFLLYLSIPVTALFEIVQITTNAATQSAPAIYDNKIVWNDTRNGNSDIYLYNISTGQEIRITTNTSTQSAPDIYNDKIVWEDWRNGNADIYLYNISTGQETQITSNNSLLYQWRPDIYDNNIVWRTVSAVYLYNISTGQETRITTNTVDQIDPPSIYDNKIVWGGWTNNNADIYMYDLSTGQETQITSNTSDQISPVIYDNKIVWEDFSNSNCTRWSSIGECNLDIYMYDLSTGQETRITTNATLQWRPDIYDNKIVWEDWRNGNADIYMATIYNDTTPPLINFSINDTSPKVNGTINITANITDAAGLLSANITYNISGILTKINFSLTGTSAQISNSIQMNSEAGSVINITVYATDAGNNVGQNSTLIKVINASPMIPPNITIISPVNNSDIFENATWLNISTDKIIDCKYIPDSGTLKDFASVKQIPSLSVKGDSWKVSTSTKKLELSEDLIRGGINSEILSNITTFIQKSDLKALASGSVTNNKATSPYNQYLYLLGPTAKSYMDSGYVVYTESDTTDISADYLFFKSGREIGRYLLEFTTTFQSGIYDSSGSASSTGLLLKDFENINLTILGKKYIE